MASIEEKVEALVNKTIQDLGYELYDVIYEKEAQSYYLRIYIDSIQGISLEDCEKVNDAINDMLDEADYIKDEYFLEISSPGIERILRKDKHLKDNLLKEITCNLFSPLEINESEEENTKLKKKKSKAQKIKQIDGILKSFDKDKIVLQANIPNQKEPVEIQIDRKNISVIKLKYHWE